MLSPTYIMIIVYSNNLNLNYLKVSVRFITLSVRCAYWLLINGCIYIFKINKLKPNNNLFCMIRGKGWNLNISELQTWPIFKIIHYCKNIATNNLVQHLSLYKNKQILTCVEVVPIRVSIAWVKLLKGLLVSLSGQLRSRRSHWASFARDAAVPLEQEKVYNCATVPYNQWKKFKIFLN